MQFNNRTRQPLKIAATQTMQSNEMDISNLKGLLQDAQSTLQPITPESGVKRYLKQRRADIQSQTINEYQRKLEYFLEFCELRGITDLNELTGRDVDEFQMWRREDSTDKVESLNSKTMRDEMYLFRSFLSYIESIEGVPSGLPDKVTIPPLADGDGIRDIELAPERVECILAYLKKYKYGHREHIVWLIHCRTGRRPGGLHSLDVKDYHWNDGEPYLSFMHRPNQGTQLKNNAKSEGSVTLSQSDGEVIQDYIDEQRLEVTDDYDREPLLTSQQGRLSKPTMRKYFYKWSRPCEISNECPHGRSIDDCTAANSIDAASKCPSSQPPYATRHGHITELRRFGGPISFVSDRCDVSKEIIEQHYDERTQEDRRQLQRKVMNELQETANDGKGGYK